MKSEFLLVAKKVLELEKHPMTAKQIVSYAIKHKIFSDKRAGKTPHQTMKSKLSVHIRKKGNDSIFVRTGPGLFYLRDLVDSDSEIYFAAPLSKPKTTERVLVFKSNILTTKERIQGITLRWKKLAKKILSPEVCTYMDRMEAESNDYYKQVLTYILVTHNGSVLAYNRGNYNRVEDFLRGASCIGFGGHVSDKDLDLLGADDMGVSACAKRELREELKLPERDIKKLTSEPDSLKCIGILNDDSSIVGQRHIAFLYNYEVSDDPYWDNPVRGEKSITKLRWLNERDGLSPIWEYEYWSQLCLRQYFKALIHTAPDFRIVRKRVLRSANILFILGEVGSGKSLATKLLQTEYGYREINTGKIVADILNLEPVPSTDRDVFQNLAWQFISKPEGPKILADRIVEAIAACGDDKVIIDGIRQFETLEKLKLCLANKNIGIIYIHTLPDIAYRFFQSRENTGISIFEFLKLRSAPVEKDVEDMIGISDAVLYNWFGEAEYRKTFRKLMRSIS